MLTREELEEYIATLTMTMMLFDWWGKTPSRVLFNLMVWEMRELRKLTGRI